MDEQRERRFTDRLWQIQAERGLTDSDLGRLLGVHVSLINHMKADRRRLGMKLAISAADHFPELRSLLFSNVPTGTDNVPTGEITAVAS